MSPAPNVRIRHARRGDLPAVMELFDELDALQHDWRLFEPRAGIRREMAGRFEAAVDAPDALLVVAEADGRVVGMAYGDVSKPSSRSDDQSVEVSTVFVRPSHRGRGLARRMVQEIAGFAWRLGLEVLTLKTFAENERSLQYWEQLGFRPRVVQMTAQVDTLRGH